VVKAAALKAKETEGELTRLRRLEANHLTELDSVKRVEQKKVENLNQRLGEVYSQFRKLRKDMDAQSQVLTATTKRWVDEISGLDRSLVGKSFIVFLPSSCRLPAVGRNSDGGRCPDFF
jgi:hypothetical protein